MTVKELFHVAGLPTTFGNPLWKDNIATGNAFLIDRLLQAGAIVFGKTNVPYMPSPTAQSYNDIYGTTNNPWDATRSPPAARRAARRRTLAAGLSGPRCRQRHCRLIAPPPAHYSGVYGQQTDLGLDLARAATRRRA